MNEEKPTILRPDQLIDSNGNTIGFGDLKTIEKNGEMQEVSMLIPICCREGHPDCPHTIKRPKPLKRNIGL